MELCIKIDSYVLLYLKAFFNFLLQRFRIITVQLDETNPVEMNLGPSMESTTINVSNLYVGGIPEGEGTVMPRTRRSFHGCIRNLVFDRE